MMKETMIQRQSLPMGQAALALVFLLGFAVSSGAQGGDPPSDCQNQSCVLAGSCYQCGGADGQGCSVKVGDCTECTSSICGGGGGSFTMTSTGAPPTDCPGLFLAADVKSASKKEPKGVQLGLLRQPDAPVSLIAATFHVETIFTSGRLRRLSEKSLVQYRVAWAITRTAKRQVEFAEGQVQAVPATARTGRDVAVPAQHVPLTSILNLDPGDQVTFFVAEASFSDGSQWRADRDAIRQRLSAPAPAASTIAARIAR
jgi:hypothetical protein